MGLSPSHAAVNLTGKITAYNVMAISTTRMSSKGQVVIPETIRKRLGLVAGAQFVVVAGEEAVILKPVVPPSLDEFDELLAEARRQARRLGLKQRDVKEAVRKARERR